MVMDIMAMTPIFVIKPQIVMIMTQMFIQVLQKYAMEKIMIVIFQPEVNGIHFHHLMHIWSLTKTGMDIILIGHAHNQMMIVMTITAQFSVHIPKRVVII